jgi:hypothetical protein
MWVLLLPYFFSHPLAQIYANGHEQKKWGVYFKLILVVPKAFYVGTGK